MIIQQPRLAWDGARVIVRVLESDRSTPGSARGSASWPDPPTSRRSPTRSAGSGGPTGGRAAGGGRLWRARLGDLLQSKPHLTEPLRDLVYEATALLAEPAVG